LHAKLGALAPTHKPLSVAFGAICQLNGLEAAGAWSDESGFEALNEEVGDLHERAADVVGRMISLKPKTLASIAAIAASFKKDQRHLWKEPVEDRDWDLELLTRFIDELVTCTEART
jgi:hypothetical protein